MIINGMDFDRKFDLAFQDVNNAIDLMAAEALEGMFECKSKNEMINEGSELLIVSDGSPFNTYVYCNGLRVFENSLVSVEIDKITPNDLLRATLVIANPKLHMRAKGEIINEEGK